MSQLKLHDRLKLERLFRMSHGYVLEFDNRSFREFFSVVLGIDIYDGTWEDQGSSKANLLRTFWGKADDQQVAKVNRELLKIWAKETLDKSESDLILYKECVSINNRLFGIPQIKNIEALQPIGADESLYTIIADIKSNIDNNNPELALDRLHNYMVKYVRKLCENHGIAFEKEDTLNSLFGKYNKSLNANKKIESKMSQKIIGSIVKLLEFFNVVRNDESAAHPNPLLNNYESLFIVDTVCSIVEFINNIEDVSIESIEETTEDIDCQQLL